jgi:fibronectin-binding autotransporter adhesin
MFRYSNNQGTIVTNPGNYWEGETTLSSGSVYFHPGALPSATNLALAASGSSWFETNGSFTRAAGTGAGQIRFNATAGRVNGLSARGGDLQVNLGGNEIEPATLSWGLDGFTPAILGLAATQATGTLTWLNPIDLNGANRTIDAQNGGADVDAVIAAQLSGAAGSALTKTGGGVIELVTANNYPGGTTVAQSQGVVNPLRVSHSNALGTGSLTIGGGGNNDQARLELSGGITLTNSIPALTSRNNDMPNFFNVAGENTITSNVSSGGGGSRVTFHSDAGNLIFTGNIATRQLNLRGEGNGELRGNVPLSTGYGINKAGGGTWILSGNATYPGTTIISGGTLQIGKGATTGTLPAGNVINDATLVFDRDGTLIVGAAISGSGELVKRGPGAVTLTAGTHDYSGRTAIGDGALIINGDAGGATGEVLVGNGSGDPASAMLGGGGVIGGDIAIASDGAIAPGSQIGDLLVLGDVAGAGSLNIEVDGDNADSLTLEGGTLTISGLTLRVSRLAAPTQAVYVIVDADSPITGAEFAAVQGLPSGYSVVYNYNYGGDSHNIAITGTPTSDPYENWATVTSGLAGDDALPGADPDHDGLSNLIEFVLGGQPNPAAPDAASNGLAPTVTTDPAKLVFTYRRTALSATQPGLKVTAAYGSDLTGWTTAVDGVNGVIITTIINGFGDGVDRIEVAIPRALASGGKLFARLGAELTP